MVVGTSITERATKAELHAKSSTEKKAKKGLF